MLALIASLVLAQAIGAQAAQAQPGPQPGPCASETHGQFDFWVGEWDVYPNGTERLVAHSSIQRISGGCTIQEQWRPLGGTGGNSLSIVNPDTGRWEQNWIGSDGTPVHFEGGFTGNAMVLTGYWADINGPGEDGLVRMSYTANADGSVRQHGEVSYDFGLNWEDSFDFVYRPHAE
jgi:hypothetical protein